MTAKSAPILPGSTVGVLGSGQLGRMFALAARRMGYRVHTLSPDTDTPTGQVADVEIVADYDDLDAVRMFAQNVDVVSFEFENVPFETAEAVSEVIPVRPNGQVLHIAQHRLREKEFLSKAGLPHTPYRAVSSVEDLTQAIDDLGTPAILKTAGFGYDGKGQWRIDGSGQPGDAWTALDGQPAVLEAHVDFDREISVVAARSLDGLFAPYGPIQNSHRNHILDVSVVPVPDLPPILLRDAIEITRTVMDMLDVVGILCVEFFVTRDGKLLINELAPRPHNSGHYTIEACVTGQFEQQLRAICGLPLGSTAMVRPAAGMANLLGDLWTPRGEPNWAAACAWSEVKLHLYGKEEPRPGRKMGHITTLANSSEEAERIVRTARKALTDPN